MFTARLAAAAAACLLALLGGAQAQDLAAQQRQDLDFLRTEYLSHERALTPETRASAERIIDELSAHAGSLTPEQLYLGFLRVNAAAGNAHSMASFGSVEVMPQTRLPLTLAWFDDAGLVVLRARAPQEDLAGAHVLAIEGRPSEEVMRVLRGYYGGPATRQNIMAPGLITLGGMLAAAGLDDTPLSVGMRLRLRDGREVERDIAFIPLGTAGVWWPSRWWSPEQVAGDDAATAISADDLPLYLQNSDAFNRAVALPELDAVYLELKSNEVERDARSFAERANAALGAAQPTNIIVDLRFNKGGDMAITGAFFERLPRRLPANGRIFIIVGRYTFSAGMAAAAIIMTAAGDRATLVGEDVGDNLRFWSEGERVCAPNSNYCARYTTGLFDLARGCRGEDRCHGENRRFNLVVGSLRPTLYAPTTWADYIAKRDPSMEAIRAALGR